MSIVTKSGFEFPTGAELIRSYKVTGAIPDFDSYWAQNGHVHACAVGVLIAARTKARGVQDVGKSMNDIERRGTNHHVRLAKELHLDGPDASYLMSKYECAVSCSNQGHSLEYTIKVHGYGDDADVRWAVVAGWAAWEEVKRAQEKGVLPKRD